MKWVPFFIRRHVLTWMLMVALILFGYLAFTKMGISEFPDVDFPVVSVDVNWEGASPELNEIQVADPIENALSTVQGVKKVYSVSRTQSTTITAEFELGTNIDVAVQDIQSAIAKIQRRLPRNIDPPVVSKTNPEDRPIMFVTIASDRYTPHELMALVRDRIRPRFSTVKGLADIVLAGFVDPSLRIWLRSDALNRYYLGALDVVDAIALQHLELPGGRIESLKTEENVRVFGEAQTIKEFGDIWISKRGNATNFSVIQLKDVADIEEGLADTRSRSRAMGKTAIGLGFRKQRGENAIEVAQAVKDRMQELQKQYGNDLDIGINFDSTLYIKTAIHDMVFNLVFSAILTSLVCWVFLGSLGATFNVVLAIPTAILGTFLLIQPLGFTLNTFTLLGLSMAIGIVVDDAIMVLENISRHQAVLGKSRYQAAVDGTQEIFFAVFATSVSLIAIFLPVIFVKGVIGTYLMQFGLTLSIAVALSMFEALTLTPMRCANMVNARHSTTGFSAWVDRQMNQLSQYYQHALKQALDHRLKVLGGAVIFMAISWLCLKGLPREFTPYQDTNRILLILRAPLGISIYEMDKRSSKVEKIIQALPEMSRYFMVLGGNDVNMGRAYIMLKDPKNRRRSQRDIANALRKTFGSIKGIKVIVQDNANRAFAQRKGFPIELSLKGHDPNQLDIQSRRLMDFMHKTHFFSDIDSDYKGGLPEVQIHPNRQACASMGVNIVEVNRIIQAVVEGVVAGQFTQKGYRYDIRVRVRESDRDSIQDIEGLQVRNNRGELVPLQHLISIVPKKIVQEINREDKERAVMLTANLVKGASQESALEAVEAYANKSLPFGYRLIRSGSSQSFQEGFSGLIIALCLGIGVAYMVLGAQFNSFLQPLIMGVAMPLGISGAILALFIGRQSLNIFTMIGLLLVLGIVLKNAILLVDFTNQKIAQGLDTQHALLEACPIRLRPILMTSFAMVAGALPPILMRGQGSETQIPMAIAVIGGIVVSTVFTLFVVPCVYSLVGRKLDGKKQR